MDLSLWPFDWSVEEQRLLADALDRCETHRQVESVLSMFLIGDILTDILTKPPVRRKRWWRF